MAKQPIGFERRLEEDKQEEIVIKNVGKEFSSLLQELELENEYFRKEVELSEKIRSALASLFKEFQSIEKKINKRHKLYSQFNALSDDDPKRALEILNEVEKIDFELSPKVGEFSNKLRKYIVDELPQVYKEVELSVEEIGKIRLVVNSLGNHSGLIFNVFNQSASSLNQTKRNFFQANPGLN